MATMRAQLRLDPDYTISPIDDRLYGGFMEHLGRHIYTGVYEPGHPTADSRGFRRDVIDLVRELGPTVVRYPGGNFVSGYAWEDGVGPKEARPRRLELAWQTTESNHFGTNEFIEWCREVGAEPMLAVNLGTRGPKEARELLEYCNHARDTELSDRRRAHGYETPHDVRLWCLGNEMDGPWQMGHIDAATYGQTARIASDLMKWTDGSIQTVACGSSGLTMGTFGTWEYETLMRCYDSVDYISAHVYYGNQSNDTPTFFARPEEMGRQIEAVAAVADAVKAIKKSRRTVNISFDEYNVWYHSGGATFDRWIEAPPQLEDVYNVEDAVVLGGMLIQLINHADRVKVACIAQLVNVIGPVMTAPGGPAWRQTLFFPFRDASRLGRGTALRALVDGPRYECGVGPDVPIVSAAAVRNEGLTVYAVNRSLTESVEVEVIAPGLLGEHWDATSLFDDDLKAQNTRETPERVLPKAMPEPPREGDRLRWTLPPGSWNVLRSTA